MAGLGQASFHASFAVAAVWDGVRRAGHASARLPCYLLGESVPSHIEERTAIDSERPDTDRTKAKGRRDEYRRGGQQRMFWRGREVCRCVCTSGTSRTLTASQQSSSVALSPDDRHETATRARESERYECARSRALPGCLQGRTTMDSELTGTAVAWNRRGFTPDRVVELEGQRHELCRGEEMLYAHCSQL